MTEARTILAPAKVNLFLGVGERRADGYHDVVTVLQTLELFDVLVLEPGRGLIVECEPDVGLPPCDNLAAVAARVLGGLCDREPQLSVHIDKRIPVGGGLGGGSSDAAAVLLGLGDSWGLAPGDPRLDEAARAVGADVPFFFTGGTALLRGRGDVLDRALPSRALDIVLVNPGAPASTAAAYAALDRVPRGPSPGPEVLIDALAVGLPAGIAAALHNDMTEASVSLVPAIGEAVSWLGGQPGVFGACMAGSGSSVFGVTRDAGAALRAADAARARGWWAVATRSRGEGVVFADAEATDR